MDAWGCRQLCYPGRATGARVPSPSASLIAKSSVGDAKGIPCTQPLSPTWMHISGLHWETWERQGWQDPPWLTLSVAAASHPLQAAGRPLSPPSPLQGHMGTCWDAWVPGDAKGPLLLPCPNLAPSLSGPPISIGLAPCIFTAPSSPGNGTCSVSEQSSARHFLMGYCEALI